MPLRDPAIWWLRLICCEREDRIEVFDSWEKADAFRESYCTGPAVAPPSEPWRGGHRRAAILSMMGAPDAVQ